MARKPRAWTTAISKVERTDVFVRGYSLLGLMGKLPFAAATYLLVRGEVPTKAQARVALNSPAESPSDARTATSLEVS